MAVDFSGIDSILGEVVDLIPTIIALVLAALPIIVVMLVAGFLTGLFDGILGKIKL